MANHKRMKSGLLDLILTNIANEGNGKTFDSIIHDVLSQENKLEAYKNGIPYHEKNRVEMALKYLIERKHIYINDEKRYCITVEGAIFYESASWFYKYRPYQSERTTEKLKNTYRLIKIVVIAINGFILLYLAAIQAGCLSGCKYNSQIQQKKTDSPKCHY